MKWLPIETAPTTGDVLAWCRGWVHVIDAEHRLERADGIAFFNGDVYVLPSHWMPLPPPPEAENE